MGEKREEGSENEKEEEKRREIVEESDDQKTERKKMVENQRKWVRERELGKRESCDGVCCVCERKK